MKDLHWYTGALFTIGLYALFGSILHINIHSWFEFLIITGLIVCLEFYPIQLPSGDEYAVATIGFLYLLMSSGMTECTYAIIISLFLSGIKKYGSLRRVKWFRFFVNVGMYFSSALVSLAIIRLTEHINIFIRVFLAVSTYELINSLLIAGIYRVLMGIPVFHNFVAKLRDLIAPIIITLIVIPRFLIIKDPTNLLIDVLYTAFFLMFIIFFSSQYIKQLSLRQDTSNGFIRLLEHRITPNLAGHGTRVGVICDLLMENLAYPKRKKHNLIQLAIIHDIGKSLLSLHVFRKRGALTLSEQKEYQSHCEKSAEIIKNIFRNDEFANWVMHHHERWDGKGFPAGLKGLEIPLESRILSLCNHIDHIMARHEDDLTVYQLLKESSGIILDPSLIEKVSVEILSSIRANISFPEPSEGYEMFELEESTIEEYSHVGQSFFLRYSDVHQLSDLDIPIPIDALSKLANLSKTTERVFHEVLNYDGRTLDVYFYPLNNEVLIFVHDMTLMMEYRKKINRKIRESYQEVIKTLSDGKIHLCLNEKQLEEQLGNRIDSIPVKSAKDVTASRSFVSNHIEHIIHPHSQMKILLAVSEATTNLIKHATIGELSLFSKGDTVQILITDKGSGIPLHELPKTILISGYSNQHSLGKGFSIMSKWSSKLSIYTSSKGTRVLMEFAKDTVSE